MNGSPRERERHYSKDVKSSGLPLAKTRKV
jgi:hypothetical protein